MRGYLYGKNRTEKLEKRLFEHPDSEYRGAPFWAWNGKLNTDTLLEQIEIMKEMGMGGFHMHVRTGMESPYLDQEFLGYIRACTEKAKKEKMLAWLYDEDRWPSGSAGGKVTREHPEYAAKSLLITTKPYSRKEQEANIVSTPGKGRGGVRQGNGDLLTCFDIELTEEGYLQSYRQIKEKETAKGKKWYVYLEHASADPWFNDASYIDTLCYEAVREFLRVTYDTYAEAMGDAFGNTIPAIFTDEPQFNIKNTLAYAREEKDVFLPWTTDLNESFREVYGYGILEELPCLLWELQGGEASVHRYRYHDFIADRFADAYCRQISVWCKEHGIRFTGHLMGEGGLKEQTMELGECMRCYRLFDIPGMDNLCDAHEYTTAKQVQSIKNQVGAEAMLSELYGVTGWDYDFRGHKLQGDWQAALGVTVRVPHLFWMTMKGEAKRDYPASIGYQSPWFPEYSMIEDHFARIHTALTRGKPIVRIGVIHPIESYWLHWGPAEQTLAKREILEERFQGITQTLLFHQLDFDFISERELPELCKQGANPLCVGQMAYEVIIVPGCETLRNSTLERLEDFHRQGGNLIFLGECPEYVDGMISSAAEDLYSRAEKVDFQEAAVVESLKQWRILEIRREDGSYENELLYQLREDRNCRWLFVATGKNAVCKDVDYGRKLRFQLQGNYRIREYDTLTGEIKEMQTDYQNDCTLWERLWYQQDSLLLELTPIQDAAKPQGGRNTETLSFSAPVRYFGKAPIELTEPNMCLLDMAEYAIDGGEWQPMEELLRIDNIAREKCGIPLRRKEVTQPYLLPEETTFHKINLRFVVDSEIELETCMLGLEDRESTQIYWNGRQVTVRSNGWYVDHAIETVPLPGIRKGKNLLEMSVPLGKRTNLEYVYLLGPFGVKVAGTGKCIVQLPAQIGMSDITHQGLPFYTGNLKYKFFIDTREHAAVRVPAYRGALIRVLVDGKSIGRIAFSPYILELTGVQPGEHELELVLFGTRQNGFGQLHHTPGIWFYQSPNSWRSTDQLWRYEYHLKEAGILQGPELYNAVYLEDNM